MLGLDHHEPLAGVRIGNGVHQSWVPMEDRPEGVVSAWSAVLSTTGRERSLVVR